MQTARQPEAIGVAGWADGITFNGKTYSQEAVDHAEAELRRHGLPVRSPYVILVLELGLENLRAYAGEQFERAVAELRRHGLPESAYWVQPTRELLGAWGFPGAARKDGA
jgi:hypothetical protein